MVPAVLPLSYSQSFDQDFTDRLELLLQEPRTLTSRDFYEIGTGPYNAADFSITKISSDSIPENTVSFLLNKQYNSGDFRITARLFDKAPALIFFDSGWFKEAISSHPSFKTALTEFKDSQEFVIPLLKSEKKLPDFKWTIFVYLLIWVSVGVHLRIVPTYSQLIPRYFTSHRFFVDDFMRYRERSASSGTFLFLQHALFTGLVAHIIATSFISPEGLGALYHHIPQAAIVGKNYASVFVLTVLLACILQLIGLFWLYLPNKAMSHFSQALNLYTWPLHLDFLIVSLMIILQQAGGSDILIVSLAVVFVLNWLTSFLITSIDGSKYLAQRRVSYIIYTFGLHLLLNILMITVILSSDYLLDLIDLVITI